MARAGDAARGMPAWRAAGKEGLCPTRSNAVGSEIATGRQGLPIRQLPPRFQGKSSPPGGYSGGMLDISLNRSTLCRRCSRPQREAGGFDQITAWSGSGSYPEAGLHSRQGCAPLSTGLLGWQGLPGCPPVSPAPACFIGMSASASPAGREGVPILHMSQQACPQKQ